MNNNPTFEERAEQMYDAAMKLREIAEFILLEAKRMHAASEKFNARKGSSTKTTTR